MSEVKRYGHISYLVEATREIVSIYPAMTIYTLATDFDAEHALRLAAEKRGDIAQRHLDRMIEHSDSLERQVGELREQLAREAVWGRFAGWLLDHCEGQEIYEERLQYWLSEMLAHEKATSTEGKDHGSC